MHVFQALHDLHKHLPDFVLLEQRALTRSNAFTQRSATGVLHDNVHDATIHDAVVKRNDVLMMQVRQQLDFLRNLESGTQSWRASQ